MAETDSERVSTQNQHRHAAPVARHTTHRDPDSAAMAPNGLLSLARLLARQAAVEAVKAITTTIPHPKKETRQ